SKVEDMRSMFEKCYSLESLNISNFRTTSAEKMHSMFNDCSSLMVLDLSSFDTSKLICCLPCSETAAALKLLI
ncbi:MAG: BspA family leucine-rich repeat surface protein, partial [Fastidiosipila sp.]|nr:BspA family leucine-rich repeat surface protein [Fastidiosipila sp.]